MARKKEAKETPPAPARPDTKAVRLDLDPEQHRQLRIAAAEMETSMAELVRGLVVDFLKSRKRRP